MREALGPFHRAIKSVIRAQMVRERRIRFARIKTIKGMIKGIETALSKPHSKAAVSEADGDQETTHSGHARRGNKVGRPDKVEQAHAG